MVPQNCLVPCWFSYWTLCMEGKKWLKKEAKQSILVDIGLNKKGNLTCEACLGHWKTIQLCTHCQNCITLCRDPNSFSHTFSPIVLNTTLLYPGCILENSSNCMNSRQSIHSKDRGESEEPMIAQVQQVGPSVVTSLSMTSSNIHRHWRRTGTTQTINSTHSSRDVLLCALNRNSRTVNWLFWFHIVSSTAAKILTKARLFPKPTLRPWEDVVLTHSRFSW